jgi:hypothetical protein
MAVAVAAAVPVGIGPRRRRRRSGLEQPVEQGERLLATAPREADMGRIRAGTLLQPDGRKDADRPGDADTRTEARGGPSKWAPVEIRARVAQADVTANPADPPVPAGANDPGGVRVEALPIGVADAVVPAAQERADDRADAVRAIGESLATDH